jgi:hypothetical protein
MKYLDYPELESLSRALTFESAECKVFTRLEAYSCKAVKRERQLFKTLESQYLHSASLSPPKHIDEALASPFGRLDQSQARKTLFLLIATLNGAFPDHDFSGVHPSDFRRESSSDSVLNSLGTTLLQLKDNSNAPRSFSSFPGSYDEASSTASASAAASHKSRLGKVNHPHLDAVLDDIMCIADCEVYTFHPDADSDPHSSAEADEEDDGMDDERYADDESISEEEDAFDGRDTQMSTPRHRASSAFDEEMDDAPMFDEDLLGFGFTPVHSRVSSAVTTPRTPSSRTRAGDFFLSKRLQSGQMHFRGSNDSTMRIDATSLPTASYIEQRRGRAYAEHEHDSSEEAEYDDSQGFNGLLWATYAFFYNRKLKRILFVSVWSRRNNVGTNQYTFSPLSYPMLSRNADDIPPLSIEQARMEAVHSKRGLTRSVPDQKTLLQARSRKAGLKRGRDLSASPAPNSRSPFPHDSPQRIHIHDPTDISAISPHKRAPHRSSNLASNKPLQIDSRSSSTDEDSSRFDDQMAASSSASSSHHTGHSLSKRTSGDVGSSALADDLSSSASSSRKHRKIGAAGI